MVNVYEPGTSFYGGRITAAGGIDASVATRPIASQDAGSTLVPISTGHFAAFKFNTGQFHGGPFGIRVPIIANLVHGDSASVAATIRTDSGGLPDVTDVYELLPFLLSPSNGATQTLSLEVIFGSPINPLTPNTDYWIVLSLVGSISADSSISHLSDGSTTTGKIATSSDGSSWSGATGQGVYLIYPFSRGGSSASADIGTGMAASSIFGTALEGQSDHGLGLDVIAREGALAASIVALNGSGLNAVASGDGAVGLYGTDKSGYGIGVKGVSMGGATPHAPTVVPSGSGGHLLAETYEWAVTFVSAAGETVIGSASAPVTTMGTVSEAALSRIPLGPAGTTERNIYRSQDAGATYALVHTIANNTATTWTDDGSESPGIAPPDNDTSLLGGNGYGLRGIAGGSGNGVAGTATGTGVGGMFSSHDGYGQVALIPAGTGTGPPTDGDHVAGELYADSVPALFFCVVGGTPGTWKTVGLS